MAQRISDLPTALQISTTDLLIIDQGSTATGFTTRKMTMLQLVSGILGSSWALITSVPNNIIAAYAAQAASAPGAAAFANIDVVIQPKGTGAIQAQLADNTTAGGNKRGTGSVDWQMTRGAATQVASGPYAVIGGGGSNVVAGTGTGNAIVGGLNNALNSTGNGNTILGGVSNSITGSSQFSVVMGSSCTTSADNTVVFGRNNTISASGISRSNILGGSDNTISNATAGVICGGSTNNSSGLNYGFIGAGNNNSIVGSSNCFIGCGSINSHSAASGYSAIVAGDSNSTVSSYLFIGSGSSNTLSGQYSFIGASAYATDRGIRGVEAAACGRFAANGDAQRMVLIQRGLSTSATPIILNAVQGNSLSIIDMRVLAANSALRFTCEIIARDNATGNTSGWILTGVIKTGATPATTAIVGSVTTVVTGQDAGAAAWAVAAVAETSMTLGALRINCTGAAATNIRWVARIETVEVQG